MSDIEIVVEFDDSPDEEIFLEAPPENEGGVPGPPGPKGDKGDKGDPGADGAPGAAGATGAKGDKGDKGDPGVDGTPGAVGATGPKGDKGDPGIDGAPGAAGATGSKGDKGDKGDPGADGAPGATGATGATGPKGDKGDKGDPGESAAAVVFFRSPLYAEDFLNDPTTTANPWTGASVGTGGTVSTAPSATHYDGNRQGILLARSGTSANSGYRYMTGLSKIRLKGGEIARFIVSPSSGSNLSMFRAGFQDSNTNADPVDGCWFTVTSTGLVTAYCASNSSSSNQPFAAIDPAQWYFLFINVVSPTQVVFSIVSMAGVLIETKTITSNIPTDAGRQTGHGWVAWNTGTNAHDVINIDYMDMQFGSLARG